MQEQQVFSIVVITSMCLGLSVASYPESANVVASAKPGPPLGCGRTRTLVSVRFQTLVVPGPKLDVTYRRFPLTEGDLATVISTSTSLPASDVGECAKKSAKAGMDAFSFEGNCTAYKFRGKLCPCLKGEKVVYLTNGSISNGSISTVPLSVAPYANTTVNNFVFKQYQLQQQLLSVVSSKFMAPIEEIGDFIYLAYLFPREDGSYNGIFVYNLDVASCVSDTPCGLPVIFVMTLPTYYFLNECGNTIDLDLTPSPIGWTVFSHPGFGCKPFPDGPTYNCTITFMGASNFVYIGFLTGNDGSCDGYTAKVTYSPNGMTQQDSDLCIDEMTGGGNVVTITLRGTSMAKTFKAGFNFRFSE